MEEQTTAKIFLPEVNPDEVIAKGSFVLEQYGLEPGSAVKVLRPEINCRDGNGLDIWVFAPKWKRDAWLSPSEYDLITPQTENE